MSAEDQGGAGSTKAHADKIKKERHAEIEKVQQTSVRELRNQLLLATDWTQGEDTPLSDKKKKEYKVYRQELRDITKEMGVWWDLDKLPEAP
jgi:hypothetical protein